MKKFLLFALLHLSLCFYKEFIDIEKIYSVKEAYNILKDLHSILNNMESGPDKTEFAKSFREYILKLGKKFISDEEFTKKLEETLSELKEFSSSDYLSASTNSLFFTIREGANNNWFKRVSEVTKKLISYCDGDTCTMTKKVITDSQDALTASASASSTWVFVSNGVGIVGHGLAAYLKFVEKYEKCKARNMEAQFISFLQTAVNVGTNIGSGAVGSVIGTLIYPGIGTVAGGFLGSLFGSFLNSKIDFKC